MKKVHNIAHVFATHNEDGQTWKHHDWFYKVVIDGKRIGKLYKSRGWATRLAKQVAKKVQQWYPI